MHTPPRKIRRRRAKSPGSMRTSAKLIGSSFDFDDAGSSFGSPIKNEQPAVTERVMDTLEDPTDPINSPPSLLKGNMTINEQNEHYDIEREALVESQNAGGFEVPNIKGRVAVRHAGNLNDMDSKKCLVCGDKATGYNFNVITCESCKAFFRRNAMRPKGGKDFKCPYTDMCDINIISRRFCQKCRLKKCFTVGMKKEWILNDDQLKRRKNSRLNGSNGKTSPHQSPMSYQHSPGSISSPVTSPGSVYSNPSLISANHMGSPSDEVGAKLGQLRRQQRSSTDDMLGKQIDHVNSAFYPSGSDRSLQSINAHPPTKMELQCNVSSPTQMLPLKTTRDTHMVRNGLMEQDIASLKRQQMLQNSFNQPSINYSLGIPMGSVPTSNNDTVTLSKEAYQRLIDQNTTNIRNNCVQPVNSSGGFSAAQSFMAPANIYQQRSLMSAPVQQIAPSAASPLDGVSRQRAAAPSALQMSSSFSSSELTSEERRMQMEAYMNFSIVRELNSDNVVSSPEEEKELPVYCNSLQGMELEIDTKAKLNSCESRQLGLVESAFAIMEEAVEPSKTNVDLGKNELTPVDVMNIMDIVMRRVVRMAKKLPAFNDLSQDGRLCLLRAAMIDILTIRGASKFDSTKQCWKSKALGENKNISSNIFDKLNDGEQKKRFMQFYETLHQSIRSNTFSMNLIALIVLFDHTQNLAEEADKIVGKRHYETYFHLLKRYLESTTIGCDEVQLIMTTVKDALKELHKVSEKATTLFVGRVKAGESEPLPTEFFKTSTDDESAVSIVDSVPTCPTTEI